MGGRVRLGWVLAALCGLAIAPPGAYAGHEGARFLVHVARPNAKNACEASPAQSLPCSGFVTRGSLYTGYHVYVVVVGADRDLGIASASFGVRYFDAPGIGVDLYGWRGCGDREYPSAGWPKPRSNLLVQFDAGSNCRRDGPPGEGARAVLGYFYVYAYSEDVLDIDPYRYEEGPPPWGGTIYDYLFLTDCSGREWNVTPSVCPALGHAFFSDTSPIDGCSPCPGEPLSLDECLVVRCVPVRPATWGGIKLRYRRDAGGRRRIAPPRAPARWPPGMPGAGKVVAKRPRAATGHS